MAPQIEIYDCLETLELEQAQVDDESLKLIEEMGLAGQKQSVNEDGKR